ncbi:hypothetical protein [Micromonospora lupini]|nr:hypothetical protein [Micromonospora lupini]
MTVTVGVGGNVAPERHRPAPRADRLGWGGAGRTDDLSLIIASAGAPT